MKHPKQLVRDMIGLDDRFIARACPKCGGGMILNSSAPYGKCTVCGWNAGDVLEQMRGGK